MKVDKSAKRYDKSRRINTSVISRYRYEQCYNNLVEAYKLNCSKQNQKIVKRERPYDWLIITVLFKLPTKLYSNQ